MGSEMCIRDSHRSLQFMIYVDLSGQVRKIPDLYTIARLVGGWHPFILQDLTHTCFLGLIFEYRSCTASHHRKSGSTVIHDLDHDLVSDPTDVCIICALHHGARCQPHPTVAIQRTTKSHGVSPRSPVMKQGVLLLRLLVVRPPASSPWHGRIPPTPPAARLELTPLLFAFFSCHLLSSLPFFFDSLPPTLNSASGSDPCMQQRLFSSLPTTVRALHFLSREDFSSFLPSSTRVEWHPYPRCMRSQQK